MKTKTTGENMRNKIICLLGFVLAGLCLSGCAAFQTSTTQVLPTVADEKPTADKALIIVEGTGGWAGVFKLYAKDVYDNTNHVGKAGTNGRLVWLRDPGKMVISINNGVVGRCVTVAAGEKYQYKIKCNSSYIYSVDGPGIAFDYEAGQQSPGVPYNQTLGQVQGQYNDAMLRQKTIKDAAQFRQQYENSMKKQ